MIKKQKNKISRRTFQKAFTLIELLVVIAIISLLSAVVLNSLASARMKANDTKISEDLRQFRIAAELYFNDNHVYPPGVTLTASLNKQNIFADKNSDNGWAKRLSFFVKTAEAAIVTHNITKLCANFDTMAIEMVSKKYLSTVPIHPYDNDAKGVCYKAVNSGSTFSAYAPLTTMINVGGGSISKRTGFILGDTSPAGIGDLISKTSSYDSSETPYPIGTNGNTATDVTKSADTVYGISSGFSGSSGSTGSNSTGTSSSTSDTSSTTPTLMTDGGYCDSDAKCQSNICSSNVCTSQLKSNGNSCSSDNQCSNNLCRNNICADPEAPYRVYGATCSTANDCDSGFCGYQLDSSPQGYSRVCSDGQPGRLCLSNSECVFGTTCSTYSSVCVSPDNSSCIYDAQCQSGSCSNNVCVTPSP